MNLYRITTRFLGKDLYEDVMLGYVVADSEEEVAEHINHEYKYSEWFGCAEDEVDEEEDYDSKEEYLEDLEEAQEWIANNKQDIVSHKGDFHNEYAGEFYDQKYGWKDMGEISEPQVSVLRELGILNELNREDE